MRMRVAGGLLVIGAIACGGSSDQRPLYAAGSDKDDGHGMLAQASARLMTSSTPEADGLPPRPRRYDESRAYGGDAYGDTSGGGYGGHGYAGYVPPVWGYPNVNRIPAYSQRAGLSGAIEGTITWRGTAPPALTTACGAIEPLRIGEARTVGGVLVYIERVSVGRKLPHPSGDLRPSTVGGVVVKRGCAFAPAAQIVTPIPAALSIHGDAQRTRVKIGLPEGQSGAPARVAELEEGGRIVVQAPLGVTRIESEDGTHGAAWVLGVDTPAYAITDDTGRFRIDELAPGTYEVTIWQPPVPTVTAGRLVYGAPVIVKRSVKVATGMRARLDVALGR